MNDLAYYAAPGLMTALSADGEAFDGLPDDPAELGAVVQGLLIHRNWQAAYGVDLPPERVADQHIRPSQEIVDRALALDGRPLHAARRPEDRVVGTCRDFTVLHTALLRRGGTPARARCGFGGYFQAGKWIDHWITEWWDGGRWRREDAQLDSVQRAALKPDFDPADQPPGKFLTGGDAWLRCRRDGADTKTFGIFDMWGGNFIVGDLIRDVASLSKVELLPWDSWGAMDDPNGEPGEAAARLFDEVADLAAHDDLAALRSRYEADAMLTVPPVIMSFFEQVATEVRIYES